MSDAEFAVFDKNGKYLYFTASTNIGPTTGWLDMSSFGHDVTRSVYVVVLRKDLPSPLAPESDEEKGRDDKADNSRKTPPSRARKTIAEKNRRQERRQIKTKIKTRTKIKTNQARRAGQSHDRFRQHRPAHSGSAASRRKDYVGYDAGKAGEFYLVEAPPRIAGCRRDRPSLMLEKFDLDQTQNRTSSPGSKHSSVSFNGEKFLYQQGDHWFIAAHRRRPPSPAKACSSSSNGSLGRPARRMEADLPRSLAHRARFLLRPPSSRRESARAEEKIRALSRRHRQPR